MPDMYDKLGDLLNEALESGKIPQKEKEKTENDRAIPDEKSENSGHFDFNRIKIKKKKQIPTGQVIKMHKYTHNMQFPPHVQKALTTLDIVYPFTIHRIKKQYHKLLKEVHPDSKKTIQSSLSVQNIRQYTVDDIVNAYKILQAYFAIK